MGGADDSLDFSIVDLGAHRVAGCPKVFLVPSNIRTWALRPQRGLVLTDRAPLETAVLRSVFDDPAVPPSLSKTAARDFQATEPTLTRLGFVTDVFATKGPTFPQEVSLGWGRRGARVIALGEVVGLSCSWTMAGGSGSTA